MKEKTPESIVATALRDIKREQREAAEAQRQREKLKREIRDVLEEHGELKIEEVKAQERGSFGIPLRDEEGEMPIDHYRETRPVSVNIGGEEIGIFLLETRRQVSQENSYTDEVILGTEIPYLTSHPILFRVGFWRDTITTWRGTEANLAELSMASTLVKHIGTTIANFKAQQSSSS